MLALAEDLSLLVFQVLRGIVDASNLHPVVAVLARSPAIRNTVLRCIALNGFIFVGSLLGYERLLLPLVRRVIEATVRTPGIATHAAVIVELTLAAAYHVLWVLPFFALSFALSAAWYQELANSAYELQVGPPPKAQLNYDKLRHRIALLLYRQLLVLLYFLFSIALYHIPVVGRPLSFLYECWIASFYAFDYKWGILGLNLHDRIRMVESHWGYFCGFGLPSTMASFFLPQFVGYGVFAVLFPAFILMANVAEPAPGRSPRKGSKSENGTNESFRQLPGRLPFFVPLISMSDACTGWRKRAD